MGAFCEGWRLEWCFFFWLAGFEGVEAELACGEAWGSGRSHAAAHASTKDAMIERHLI